MESSPLLNTPQYTYSNISWFQKSTKKLPNQPRNGSIACPPHCICNNAPCVTSYDCKTPGIVAEQLDRMEMQIESVSNDIYQRYHNEHEHDQRVDQFNYPPLAIFTVFMMIFTVFLICSILGLYFYQYVNNLKKVLGVIIWDLKTSRLAR